jgi:DNA-binding CsgD family transcriptional regulator
MAVETFVDQLVSTAERVSRTGVNGSDVAVLAGVAHLFPGAFSICYDQAGTVLWASPSFNESMGRHAHVVPGKKLSDFFRAAWCEERLAIVRRAIRTGTPVSTVEIFRGRRLEGAYLPAMRDAVNPTAVFVGRFGIACPLPGDACIVRPEHLLEPEWGEMAELSRRELEVLRLIAMGLDNAQIAKAIHRTKRAVEWHISGLYRCLNVLQRTDLFRTGLLAGLPEIDEDHWNRMMERVHNHHAEPAIL